jgi:hypothetical protein
MRHYDELNSIPCPELQKQVREMRLDGRHADEQLGGDLTVRQAAPNENENLVLAPC